MSSFSISGANNTLVNDQFGKPIKLSRQNGGTLFITGVWNGASAQVSIGPNPSNYVPLGGALTQNGDVTLPPGNYFLKVVTTGGAAGTALTVVG